LKDDLEHVEDEVKGLESKLVNLRLEEKSLKDEEKETAEEIKKARLVELAREYNKIAAKLADTVKEIWDVRDQIGDVYNTYKAPASQGQKDPV